MGYASGPIEPNVRREINEDKDSGGKEELSDGDMISKLKVSLKNLYIRQTS